jgi:hypothetical protein
MNWTETVPVSPKQTRVESCNLYWLNSRHVFPIPRASCQKDLSTKLLVYRRLNCYGYLAWQMCIFSAHTPKCNCLYLCVEQHQYYALLAWHTSHYFMLLDQISPIMQICWYSLLAWCLQYMYIIYDFTHESGTDDHLLPTQIKYWQI